MVSRIVSVGCLAFVMVAMTAPAKAVTIILDTFTAPDGTQLEGRAPAPTNLPNGTWNRANQFWGSSIQGNAFNMGPDNGWTVPLATSLPYTRPSSMAISADIAVQNMDNGSGNGGGVGLGFDSVQGASPGPYQTFTGLRLDQFGTLTYRTANADVASVAWSGPAFNSFDFYNLSYTIDTTTGNLSNIQLVGSTADFSTLIAAAVGGFTLAKTTYAAFLGNSGNAGGNALIDNFQIEEVAAASSVPEPSTLMLSALGLGSLVFVALRRTRRGRVIG